MFNAQCPMLNECRNAQSNNALNHCLIVKIVNCKLITAPTIGGELCLK